MSATAVSAAALVLGTPVREVEVLCAALPATLVEVPSPSLSVPDVTGGPGGSVGSRGPGGTDGTDGALGWAWAEELDRWRDELASGEPVGRVVVAPWDEAVAWAPLADVPLDDWMARCEVPLARWWAAMGLAARICADGGAVVAVVERPPPLDSSGWSAAAAVAEAAENMVRSLARAVGGRGVRVNAVTTPLRLQGQPLVGPAPPLPGFPGTVQREVVGAVRMLLGADAAGVTGTAIHVDHGRSWR